MLPPTACSVMSWMLLSCLMLLSQVQGEDSLKNIPSARISCPKGSQAYGSYCYALFQIPQTWFDAELACQKRPGGHLVSVLNSAEASFLSSMVKRTGNSYQYTWIGELQFLFAKAKTARISYQLRTWVPMGSTA